MEDIKQIEQLQRIYGYYWDYSEWDQIVALFADNPTSVEIADYGVYRGSTDVKRFYIDLMKGGDEGRMRPGWLSINMQLQGVVTVEPDGKTAKGRWYGFMMEARPTWYQFGCPTGCASHRLSSLSHDIQIHAPL